MELTPDRYPRAYHKQNQQEVSAVRLHDQVSRKRYIGPQRADSKDTCKWCKAQQFGNTCFGSDTQRKFCFRLEKNDQLGSCRHKYEEMDYGSTTQPTWLWGCAVVQCIHNMNDLHQNYPNFGLTQPHCHRNLIQILTASQASKESAESKP